MAFVIRFHHIQVVPLIVPSTPPFDGMVAAPKDHTRNFMCVASGAQGWKRSRREIVNIIVSHVIISVYDFCN